MVRDESSADGQQPNTEPETATPQSPHTPLQSQTFAPEGAQAGAGNLTQELAQLLAATIAHNQAQRGGGIPTGADLVSLASLMTAASQHRTLAPAFKDGLSSLSYTQLHPSHRQPGAPHVPSQPHTGPAELSEPHHDDEPMPIPSTWRQPVQNEQDRWFRQQMGAAVLGLCAGLLIVVPTVLWLSGWIGPSKKTTMAAIPTVEVPKAADVVKTVRVQVRPVDKPEAAAAFVTGSVEAKLPELVRQADNPVTIATAKVAPEVKVAAVEPPQRSRTDELLTQANRRIESGDIPGARELLAGAEPQAQGPASFALAETYDPNMLAAWGTRGAVADVARARALYSKALDLGVTKAQVRLEGLK